MCLICVEIQKETLSAENLKNNIVEIIESDPKHAEVIIEELAKSNPEFLDELENDLFDLFSN